MPSATSLSNVIGGDGGGVVDVVVGGGRGDDSGGNVTGVGLLCHPQPHFQT